MRPLGSFLTSAPDLATAASGSAIATQRWICEPCGMVYDPVDGDIDGGIPPGTPFEDIPNDWTCPVCGARKKDFVPLIT